MNTSWAFLYSNFPTLGNGMNKKKQFMCREIANFSLSKFFSMAIASKDNRQLTHKKMCR